MIISSGTKKPKIHPSAYVAPSAVLSGEVTVEEGAAILHGAVLAAEGAPLVVGAHSVVMENAVLKASGGSAMQFALSLGEKCIVGPGAYVVGATVAAGCFVAAGAKVFNGARLEENSAVALGAVVHVGTRLPAGTLVPMQHIAHGDPAVVYPPERAQEVHARLNFFETVFNLPHDQQVRAKAAQAYSRFLRKTHAQDAAVSDAPAKKPAAKTPPAKSREEPPPTQAVEVEKVVDVMFVELEEARLRRERALEREKQHKKR